MGRSVVASVSSNISSVSFTSCSNLIFVLVPSALQGEMNTAQLEEPQKNKKPKKKGDRLTVQLFENQECYCDWSVKDDLEIYFVVSVLNFQRQFAACCASKSAFCEYTFGGELWGKSHEIDRSRVDEKDEGQECVVEGFIDSEASGTVTKSKDYIANFDIPTLNATQQMAADSCLVRTAPQVQVRESSWKQRNTK